MSDKNYTCEHEKQFDPKLNIEMKSTDDRSEAFWKENFGKITELSVMFADNMQRGANIYGNKNNSVGVLVNIKITGRGDNANKPINLSPEFLMDNVGLCEYSSGNDLAYGYDKQSMSGWFWRTKGRVDSHNDQDFIGAVDFRAMMKEMQGIDEEFNVLDSETTQYPLYISCSKMAALHNISAYVNIPGIGKFNCSMNGTSTPNGNPADSRPAGPFKQASTVGVEALAPVNYEDATSVKVTQAWSSWRDWEFPINDMAICLPNGQLYKHNGTFSYNPVSLKIYPNTDNYKIKGSRFVRKSIEGASGGDIKTMRWTSFPSILRGVGGGSYDLSAIFVDKNYCGVNSDSRYYLGHTNPALGGTECYYSVGVRDGRLNVRGKDEISDNYIKVDIRNFCVSGWGNLSLVEGNVSGETAWVTVYDEFGNSGRVKIQLQDNDWPKVRINGQLAG
ncbi:hypothetical protein [Cedecea sp.]|jgi:hypothetical protein|uniref:hypothetical protein n=1 Tax=Cedecea sp. TaxID=1970739 RepID=UPI002F3FED2B